MTANWSPLLISMKNQLFFQVLNKLACFLQSHIASKTLHKRNAAIYTFIILMPHHSNDTLVSLLHEDLVKLGFLHRTEQSNT